VKNKLYEKRTCLVCKATDYIPISLTPKEQDQANQQKNILGLSFGNYSLEELKSAQDEYQASKQKS